MASERGDWVLSVVVEGVGLTGSADRQIRWSGGAYAGDTDSAYASALLRFPASLSGSVNFKRGQSSVGGVSFTLRASPLALSWFARLDVPRRVGLLAVAIDGSDTTLEIDTSTPADLVGLDVLLGREVIRLGGSYTGSGPYSYASCARGRWGTTATGHEIAPRRGVFADTQIFLASHFNVQLHRVVRLLRAPRTGTGYGDEVQLGAWVLKRAHMPSPQEIVLECEDLLELVNKRTLLKTQARLRRTGSTNNFEGDAPLAYQGAAAGLNRALFRAGDKTGIDARWSGDLVDFPATGSVYLDTTHGDFARTHAGCPVLLPEDLDAITEITEIFSTHPDAPDLNSDGGRLSTNLLDLLRQILATTASATYGTAGANGAYDLGLGLLGCGVPDNLIDHDSFDAAKLALGPLAEIPALYLQGPENAWDLLVRLCRVVSGALVRTAEGKIGFSYYRAFPDAHAPALTQASLTAGEVGIDFARDRILERVLATFGERPGVQAVTVPFDDAYQGARYPSADSSEEKLDLRGAGGGSFEQAVASARALALSHLARWRYHPPVLTFEALPLADLVTGLREGATFTLTHALIPGLTGTKGITGVVGIVTSFDHDFSAERPSLRVTALLVGVAYDRFGAIAPAAGVVSVAGSVVTVDDRFCSAKVDGQANDTFGFTAGDPVIVRTRDRSTTRGVTTITAINAATPSLTLASVPAGTAAGDIITLRDYDNQSAGNKSAYASLADAAGLVGTALDDGYPWTA